MAYTFFPKSATEIKTTLKGDSKKIDDIVKLSITECYNNLIHYNK